MTNFLTIAKLLLALIPLVIQAVTQIEQAFPQSGQGAAKLELVKSVLQTAADKSADYIGKFEEIWPALQNMISAVVTLANNVGLFKK